MRRAIGVRPSPWSVFPSLLTLGLTSAIYPSFATDFPSSTSPIDATEQSIEATALRVVDDDGDNDTTHLEISAGDTLLISRTVRLGRVVASTSRRSKRAGKYAGRNAKKKYSGEEKSDRKERTPPPANSRIEPKGKGALRGAAEQQREQQAKAVDLATEQSTDSETSGTNGAKTRLARARLVNLRAVGDVSFVPWPEPLAVTIQDGAVTVRYGLRVPPRGRGAAEVSGKIEIVSVPGERILASIPIQRHLTIIEPAINKASLDLNERARAYFERQARNTYGALASLRTKEESRVEDREIRDSWARGDVGTIPNLTDSSIDEIVAVDAFLRNVLRAQTARQRLEKIAFSKDTALAERAAATIAAIAAVGRSSSPNRRERATAANAEIANRAVDLAAKALNDLRLSEAEALLKDALESGQLTRARLSKALAIMAGVKQVAHGDEADRMLGQAMTLEPHLEDPFQLSFLQRWFELTSKVQAPRGPLRLEEVTARKDDDDGAFEIKLSYAGDPFGLAAGGDVEIWGTGGRPHDPISGRSDSAKRTVTLRVPASSEILNYRGQLLLKAHLRDVSGVALASFGEPEPKAVMVTDSDGETEMASESESHSNVLWWTLAIAGAVIVIGSATAGTIAFTHQGTPSYRIGPISADF